MSYDHGTECRATMSQRELHADFCANSSTPWSAITSIVRVSRRNTGKHTRHVLRIGWLLRVGGSCGYTAQPNGRHGLRSVRQTGIY